MSAAGTDKPKHRESLKAQVRALPLEPGVYIFRDKAGTVLYVGKAQSLRARVRSYFVRGGDGRYRMSFLVPRIYELEVVVTSNVKEALLLENQLIKKFRPRFNVRLRDDKNYLALRLDPKQVYPRFNETRGFLRDGAIYFGPYTSSVALHKTLGELQQIFPLRTCSDAVLKSYRRQGRPCLEHSLGRCAAPCCHLVTDADYGELVKGAVLFMRGKAGDLLHELRARMEEAAREERYEAAARLRDRILAIERTVETQSMVSTRFADQDVFALARDGGDVEIQVMHVRQGKLMGGTHHSFRKVRLDDAEVIGSFLSQYYGEDRQLPRDVLIPLQADGQELLAEAWRERAGRAVRIVIPRRGERRKLLQLAERNAALALAERGRRERRAEELLSDLQNRLHLPALPVRIECYDVSHLQGTLHVASRVVFVDGQPFKDGYRRYRLRETEPGDDYGAMREVLRRRLARVERDPIPDFLLLDGGKGQLNAAAAVFQDMGLEPGTLASLAKERDEGSASKPVQRHGGTKREKLFLCGVKDPLMLPPDSPALLLLQRIRDESHRFAIRYHRELRQKAGLRSILDELPGIGPVKRKALLRSLGSLEQVKRASLEDLASVPKISRSDARMIHGFFKDVAESSDVSTTDGAK